MFVGHYAAAMAAKSAEPRAPLWTYVAGCQLIDIGWSVFVMTGIEHFRIDPSLGAGSALVLYDMPYTHSLPASLLWSLGAGLLACFVLRLPGRACATIGLVVFSHWILDLIVHRPDLELWFGDRKVGFAMWDMLVSEMALEMGLVAIAGALWVAQRKSSGRTAWPAVLFLAFLTVLQLGAAWPGGLPPSTFAFGLTALVLYLVASAVAVLVDRQTLKT